MFLRERKRKSHKRKGLLMQKCHLEKEEIKFYLANIFNLLSGCSSWHPPLNNLKPEVSTTLSGISQKHWETLQNDLPQFAVKDGIGLGIAVDQLQAVFLCKRRDGSSRSRSRCSRRRRRRSRRRCRRCCRSRSRRGCRRRLSCS